MWCDQQHDYPHGNATFSAINEHHTKLLWAHLEDTRPHRHAHVRWGTGWSHGCATIRLVEFVVGLTERYHTCSQGVRRNRYRCSNRNFEEMRRNWAQGQNSWRGTAINHCRKVTCIRQLGRYNFFGRFIPQLRRNARILLRISGWLCIPVLWLGEAINCHVNWQAKFCGHNLRLRLRGNCHFEVLVIRTGVPPSFNYTLMILNIFLVFKSARFSGRTEEKQI